MQQDAEGREEEKEEADWWMFYPLCGIDVTDARHGLRKPLFGDVTLVSKRHLREVIALMPHHEGSQESKAKHDASLASYMKQMADEESAEAFLAVRRRGSGDEESDHHEPAVVYEARERAYEVASLLAVVTLASDDTQMACGLAEQIYRRPEHLAMLDIEGGWYSLRRSFVNPASLFTPEVDRSLSRAALKRLLLRRPFAPLTGVLLTKDSLLPDSLRRSIKQAVLRLADAIHGPTNTAQLLGAVITLELLFRVSDQERYQVNTQRLVAFLGKPAADRFEIEEIFGARHKFVHEGREVGQEHLAYQAVVLALLCLIRYATAVASFRSKQGFVGYLDFLYQAERQAEQWDDKGRKVVKRLLRHDREAFQLPFGPLVKDEWQ